jgi:porin
LDQPIAISPIGLTCSSAGSEFFRSAHPAKSFRLDIRLSFHRKTDGVYVDGSELEPVPQFVIVICLWSIAVLLSPSLYGQAEAGSPHVLAPRSTDLESVTGVAASGSSDPLRSDAIPPDTIPPDLVLEDEYDDVSRFESGAELVDPTTDDRPESLIEALGLGRWRARSRDLGISRRRTISLFYQGVASGGTGQEFVFAPKMDNFIAIDMAKLAGLEGFSIDFHVENRFGQTINPLTGSVLPANFALQFPRSTGQASALTNLQFRQYLTNDFAITLGKLNTADRYSATPFLGGYGTDRFQNSAFVVNPAFGRAIPYSTLGAGFTWYRDKDPIASVLVVDPTGRPDTAGFEPMLSNGVSLLGQLRIPVRPADLPGHQTFEAVWSSGAFSPTLGDDYIQLPESGLQAPRRSGTWAVNYGFDQYLVHDDANPGKGWGLFGNATLADARTNPVEAFANLGIAGNRLVRARPGDSFGLAYFYGSPAKSVGDFSPIFAVR